MAARVAATELLTTRDFRLEIGEFRRELDAFRQEVMHQLELVRRDQTAEIQQLRGDMHRMEARLSRWMLTFFATLWLGVVGLIVAILVTS